MKEIIKSRRLLIVIISIFILLFLISFLFPELTIRRHVLLSLHPISSFTIEINDTGKYDREYGHLYHVEGYNDRVTKDELNVFYLKKTGPFWSVSDVGTGP